MDSFKGLCEILAEEYQLAPESLTPETPLSDLAIDSLGVIELIFAIEEKFGVTANDADNRSMRDFVTLTDVTVYIDELRARCDIAVPGAAGALVSGAAAPAPQ